MDYRHYIVNDRPDGAWTYSTGALRDYSGNGKNATAGATLSGASILANSVDSSIRTNSATVLSVPSGIMNPGTENDLFTIEAWFKPETVTTAIQVFGRAGAADGLIFDGTAIHFVTTYASAGECRATYYPDDPIQTFFAVGVHEDTRNVLYVDGVEVASTDLSDAQRLDVYAVATTPNVLNSGTSATGTNALLLDGLATYRRALSEDVISQHYATGTTSGDPDLSRSFLGGSVWSLSDLSSNIAYQIDFFSSDDWKLGIVDNANVVGDELIAAYDSDGLTEAGTWKYGDILTSLGTLAGSKIEWDSEGPVTVETSINGTTWSAATNGGQITNVGSGYNPDNTTLSVRISFSAGSPLTAKVNSLTIKLYSSLSIVAESGTHSLVPTGSVSIGSVREPALNRNSKAGIKLTGGRTQITPLVQAPTINTIEGWFVFDTLGATPFTVIDTGTPSVAAASLRWTGSAWSRTALDLYVNGVLNNSPTFVAGRAYHLTFNLTTGVSTNIYLGSNRQSAEPAPMTIGDLAVFETKLTAPQISTTYRSYVGLPSVSLTDVSVLRISEPSLPSIYAYAWSIISA